MARCLIIGCGCRGRLLAAQLTARGHAVRGTTRNPGRLPALEQAGVEAHLGDPDRVATLTDALEHVSVACLLLGCAEGPPQELSALHGPRLEMLLTKMVDTTIRGVAYEAAGRVHPSVLRAGAEIVARSCEASLTPYRLLETEPGPDPQLWLTDALSAVLALLGEPAEPAAA